MFFRVQVFQGPGPGSGSRVRVQVLEVARNMKNSPRKQETRTMAKRHNTGWDMSTCCIFTTHFQVASEQEICICTYIAYSEWQHYFLLSIIKTTHASSPCIMTSYLNLRITIPTFMKSSKWLLLTETNIKTIFKDPNWSYFGADHKLRYCLST